MKLNFFTREVCLISFNKRIVSFINDIIQIPNNFKVLFSKHFHLSYSMLVYTTYLGFIRSYNRFITVMVKVTKSKKFIKVGNDMLVKVNSILNRKLSFIYVFIICLISFSVSGQIDNTGCVAGNFGVDAGLYSGVIEYGDGTPANGTSDWFAGPSGTGVISEANTASLTSLLMAGGNPLYEERMAHEPNSIVNNQILLNGIYTRDYFGGTGHIDITSYETASKNGEDPAIWDIGQANVLGKNDIINVAGHMLRDGTSLTDDLWFFGIINRAEPGGSAYMDFEFFVEEVGIVSTPVSGDAGEGYFTSGGPDLGHTAFTFNASGQIQTIGDFIFNTSLINGGTVADVEMRIWVSYTDYTTVIPASFTWGPEYDGAFTGSPFGYASIIPNNSNNACGLVNLENQNPTAPPWGTLNTKTNIYGTSYQDYSIVELGVNMTAFGIDNALNNGADPCEFTVNTFMVKTRASEAFTAQLKDFAGPYAWGEPDIPVLSVETTPLSCENPVTALVAETDRTDLTYLWSTDDGNIISDPTAKTIQVDEPGTYILIITLPTGCDLEPWSEVIVYDPNKPFFDNPTSTSTVSCNGTDGAIDLTVTGGTPPYSFLWSNGSTDEDPTNLSPGLYSVTISDTINCSIVSDSILIEPESPANISFTSSDVICFGDNSGWIDITVSGDDPFTYEWSNGSLSEDLNDLYAGTYTITVTDNEGCTESTQFIIDQPTIMILSISATDDTDPDTLINNGSINLTVSGGTPGYTYDWDNNGSQDPDTDLEDLTDLSAGLYIVTVTDNNGCTDVIAAPIFEPEICDDGIDNDGNGLVDCFDAICSPLNPGIISESQSPVCVGDTSILYSIVDVGAFSYIWTIPEGAVITNGQGTSSITVDWISNNGGEICVVSTSAEGCESQANTCVEVTINDVPVIPQPINVTNGN